MQQLDQVVEILERIKPGVDFHKETDLFGSHILTSLEIMMLTSELNDAFDISITLPYIKPENFRSAQTICAMVEQIIDED